MFLRTTPDMHIRVRPWDDANSLYFPYDYHYGGKGVLIPNDDAAQRRALVWSPIGFVGLPFGMILLITLYFTHYQWWGIMLGIIAGAGAGYGFYRLKVRMFANIMTRYPAAPVTLTEERYWQEYASQQSWGRIVASVIFWSLLLTSITMSLTLDTRLLWENPMLGALHIFGFAYGVYHFRHALLRIRHKQRAIQLGIQAGQPLHDAAAVAANAD